MNDQVINTLIHGTDDSITAAAKQQLEQSLRTMSKELENAQMNKSTRSLLGPNNTNQGSNKGSSNKYIPTDSQIYTNISEMINGNDKDPAGFGTLLDSLVLKNKKYYSIIKDYEIMPILIPQINRVLMFLVNECLSPDIQNEATFPIKYVAADRDEHRIQDDIDAIKKEMKLDNLLRDIYMNRYKLGHEYYLVVDYQNTFDHMLQIQYYMWKY